MHQRRDAVIAAARRAADEHFELVGRDVVRALDGTAQQSVDVRAASRLAPKRPQRLDGDPELERRPGREARARSRGAPAPVGEVPYINGAGAEGRRARAGRFAEPARRRHADAPARPGARRQPEHVAHRGAALGPPSVVAVTRTVTSRRGSGTRRSNLRPRMWCERTILPPARTTSSFVPRGALPATCPKEISYGAGAERRGREWRRWRCPDQGRRAPRSGPRRRTGRRERAAGRRR